MYICSDKHIDMGVIFNKYINNKDHTWYDSTNVIYSLCYDSNTKDKVLKVVFKGGRTYLYKDVDVNDYVSFRMAESTGKAVNEYIVKKYKGVRLQDTDLGKLDELKEELENNDKITEEAFSNLAYHLSINNDSGDFLLSLNDKPIYKGKEGEVSIINLLKCMNIHYSISNDYVSTEDDYNNNELGKDE